MMDRIDLRGKQWLTLGLKGRGKSNFNKWLLQQRPRHFVFDPMDEYPDSQGYNQYVPQAKRGDQAVQELDLFIDEVIKENSSKLDYLVVDEVNRFHTKGGTLDGAVGELLDLNRHWDIGVGTIARRPTQVHTDIREMSDYIFIFGLTGRSDMKTLEDMATGLADAVRELGPYQFVMVDPSREIHTMQPVPSMD